MRLNSATSLLHKENLAVVSVTLLGVALGLHIYFSLLPVPVFGDDAPTHPWWLEDFSAMRAIGIEYPRWLDRAFGGLGSPVFYFYPPLAYYLSDLVSVATGVTEGAKLFMYSQLLTLLLGIGTAYLFLSKLACRRTALIGALLYGVAPYRYLDVFTRSALTEHAAFIWLPLLFLSCEHLASSLRVDRMKSVVLGTIAISGLMVTNIPYAAFFITLLPIYVALRFGLSQLSKLSYLAVAGILASLICGAYLLPLMDHLPLIQTDKLWGFSDIGSRWSHTLYEFFVPGARRDSVAYISLFTLFISAGAAVYYWHRRNEDRRIMTWITLIVICSILQLPFVSDWIWASIKPLHYLQFSWRLAGPLTLALVVLIVLVRQQAPRSADRFVLVIAAFSVFWYVKFFYVYLTYPAPPDMIGELRRSAREYVPVYASHDYINTLRQGRWRLSEPAVKRISGNGTIDSVREGTASLQFVTSSEDSLAIVINKYYWPDFVLRVDDRITPISPSDSGRIQAAILPGKHDVELHIRASDSEKLGIGITAIGLTLFSVICLVGYYEERKNTREHRTSSFER